MLTTNLPERADADTELTVDNNQRNCQVFADVRMRYGDGSGNNPL